MSEPSTPLERAQHIAHLMGGNGLSTDQQVALVAVELEKWSKADNAECERNFSSTVKALMDVTKLVGNDDRVPEETYKAMIALVNAWEVDE